MTHDKTSNKIAMSIIYKVLLRDHYKITMQLLKLNNISYIEEYSIITS